jgi:hypothetical protein
MKLGKLKYSIVRNTVRLDISDQIRIWQNMDYNTRHTSMKILSNNDALEQTSMGIIHREICTLIGGPL